MIQKEEQKEIFVQGGMLVEEREIGELGYTVQKKDPIFSIYSPNGKEVLKTLRLIGTGTVMVMNDDEITYCSRVIIKVKDGIVVGECYRGDKSEPYNYIYES